MVVMTNFSAGTPVTLTRIQNLSIDTRADIRKDILTVAVGCTMLGFKERNFTIAMT
ncbi:MAG: hypothetical protein ACFFB2_04260 [Promethearchaeota archaeon]